MKTKTNLMAKAEAKTKKKVKQLPYEEFLDILNELEGVTLLIGQDGKPKAIQIELLEKYADLFEDFFDVAIAQVRLENDDFVPFEDFVKELEAEGKI